MSEIGDSSHALERYLRTARVVGTRSVDPAQGGGHPGKFAVLLEGGVLALAKPANPDPESGEQVCKHEVAAWVIARALGWTDLVAATVLRSLPSPDGDEVIAALQVMWPAPMVEIPRLEELADGDVWRAAVFDYLTAPSDRRHNWMGLGHRPDLKLALFDHGKSFGWNYAVQSDFLDAKAGQPVPIECLEALKGLLDQEVRTDMVALLEAGSCATVIERAEALREAGVLPPA